MTFGGRNFQVAFECYEEDTTTALRVEDVAVRYAERVFGEADNDTVAALEQRRNLTVVLILFSFLRCPQGNSGQ